MGRRCSGPDRGRRRAKLDPATLDGRLVGRLEVLHVLHAVVKAEARLVDLAADKPDELLFDEPGAVVLRRDRRWLEALVARARGKDFVATLLVGNGGVGAIELDPAFGEASGPV